VTPHDHAWYPWVSACSCNVTHGRHQLRDGVPLGVAGRSSALASSALRVFCRPALQLEQVARRLS
jgi:hypothetical protein